MDRQAIAAELRNVIGNYLNSQGFEFVDLVYRYEGKDLSLRILVDRPEGGITLGECAYINEQISLILDEKEIIPMRYILEVSSPGLDRSLETKGDFLRCKNRKVKFFLNTAINGKMEFEGVIDKVEDNSVSISIGDGIIEIPLSRVAKAKQII